MYEACGPNDTLKCPSCGKTACIDDESTGDVVACLTCGVRGYVWTPGADEDDRGRRRFVVQVGISAEDWGRR